MTEGTNYNEVWLVKCTKQQNWNIFIVNPQKTKDEINNDTQKWERLGQLSKNLTHKLKLSKNIVDKKMCLVYIKPDRT